MNKYSVLLISVILYILSTGISVFGQPIVGGYQYTSMDTIYDRVFDGKDLDPANSVMADTTAYFSLYNAIGLGTIFGKYDTSNGETGGVLPPGLRVDLQVSDTLGGNWASLTGGDSIFSLTNNSAVPSKWYYDEFTIPPCRYGRFIVVCDTVPWLPGTAADTSKYHIKLVFGKK